MDMEYMFLLIDMLCMMMIQLKMYMFLLNSLYILLIYLRSHIFQVHMENMMSFHIQMHNIQYHNHYSSVIDLSFLQISHEDYHCMSLLNYTHYCIFQLDIVYMLLHLNYNIVQQNNCMVLYCILDLLVVLLRYNMNH